MGFLRLMIAGLLLVMVGSSVGADDEADGEGCAAADYLALIEAADIEAADDVAAAVRGLRLALAAHEAACAGLAWSSDEEGSNAALGPVTLEAGTYIVNVDAADFFMLQANLLSDGCGWDMELFLISHMSVVENARDVVQVDRECRLLLDVSSRSAWSIFWERVD